MNRLIFAIMFAIALALSFVRVTGSNMSMTDDFQPDQSKSNSNWTEPSKWLSKVAHIFGEYKPVAGTVTLADTSTTVKPKSKQQIVSPPQTATNSNQPITPSSISRDGFDVSAVINPDSSDSTKAVAEITLTNPGTLNEPGCSTCKVVFDESISSDVTKQAGQVNDLMNQVLAQAKNAKTTGNIELGDDSDGRGKHKKKKDSDDVDQDEYNAKLAADTCKVKKAVQYTTANKDHDVGDWGTKGDYKNDPDGYNRCLQKMAKKFNDPDSNDDLTAEVSRKLATALPQAFQACLAAGDACDRDAWSKWQEDNPAQAMIAWHDYMATQYGNGVYNQAQQLAKMGPQGEAAAYALLANNAQKIMNDPNAAAHYQNDVMGYNAMRASYADNKPDNDDPHASMANLAFGSAPQVYNPTDLSNAYTNLMGTVQKNALKQGYDLSTGQAVAAGQTQSALAGASGLNPLTVQAVQAAGLKVCVVGSNGIGDGRDCDDRGRNYGTGALFSFDPTKDYTDLGTIAFRLGQQNANLTATGIANGSINANLNTSTTSLPWANNTTIAPSALQQNALSLSPSRVSSLRQVGS